VDNAIGVRYLIGRIGDLIAVKYNLAFDPDALEIDDDGTS